MPWVLAALALTVVVVVAVWTNAPPRTCPACRRTNVFRRTRTGRRREERDDEGILVRASTEVVCGRCGVAYWVVRDDFAGCYASLPEP